MLFAAPAVRRKGDWFPNQVFHQEMGQTDPHLTLCPRAQKILFRSLNAGPYFPSRKASFFLKLFKLSKLTSRIWKWKTGWPTSHTDVYFCSDQTCQLPFRCKRPFTIPTSSQLQQTVSLLISAPLPWVSVSALSSIYQQSSENSQICLLLQRVLLPSTRQQPLKLI